MAFEIWTNVEINGTQYAIKKFPAAVGLSIARMVLANAGSFVDMLAADKDTSNEEVLKALMTMASTVSDNDLQALMRQCLQHCYVVYPAGNQAVVDAQGNYGVPDVEYDLALSLRLCFEAIKWGAADFFGGKGLTSIFGQMSSSRRQNQ